MKSEKLSVRFFILILPFVFLIAQAADENPKRISNSKKAQLSAPSLDFNAVERLIRKKHIKSADDLIAALPADYRQFYTLAYESRSLQSSGDTTPRIILYGPDAQLVMTFTGDPKKPDYQTVETMEYDRKTYKFTLREIKFDPDSNSKPTISKSPQKCIACHGEPSRPVWDPYPVWHGVFGSRSSDGRDRIGADSEEGKKFYEFLKSNRFKGRYASLPSMEITQAQQAKGHNGNYLITPNGAVTDPNGFLSEQLADLMARKAADEIKKAKGYQRFRNTLFFLSICGDSIPEKNKVQVGKPDGSTSIEWLPNDLHVPREAYLGENDFSDFLDRYRQVVSEQFDARVNGVRKANPATNPETDGVGIANFALSPHGGEEKAV